MSKQRKYSLSWNPDFEPETEDRLAFLRLSAQERWNHIMAVILATYPKKNLPVTFHKRQIEWTSTTPST